MKMRGLGSLVMLLSYVIGAKCKQLLKPNCCLDRSWGNKLIEALKSGCIGSATHFQQFALCWSIVEKKMLVERKEKEI